LKGVQQMSLSLAQSQGGSALKRMYPTHINR
jgi:hypothetical protein